MTQSYRPRISKMRVQERGFSRLIHPVVRWSQSKWCHCFGSKKHFHSGYLHRTQLGKPLKGYEPHYLSYLERLRQPTFVHHLLIYKPSQCLSLRIERSSLRKDNKQGPILNPEVLWKLRFHLHVTLTTSCRVHPRFLTHNVSQPSLEWLDWSRITESSKFCWGFWKNVDWRRKIKLWKQTLRPILLTKVILQAPRHNKYKAKLILNSIKWNMIAK